MGFILLPLSFLVLGFIANHWVALLLPAVGWPVYFLGLALGAWGYGLGESWALPALLIIAASIGGVLLGIALRRLVEGRRSPPRPPGGRPRPE